MGLLQKIKAFLLELFRRTPKELDYEIPLEKERAYPNPLKAYPRNFPCPCGSGAKWKKCHVDKIPDFVNEEQCGNLYKIVKAADAGHRILI